MKIISEEFSTGELARYGSKNSYVQYKTIIDIGEEHPWSDVSRKVFELDSPAFKATVNDPTEFILLARRTTQAVFFRYLGQKLYPDIWKSPT